MKEVSFYTTTAESDLILKIVERSMVRDRLSLNMDLSACHANGCALDFEKLLAADDFTFFHDVGGIVKNMNRSTGKLNNCFLPRCAK